MMIRISKIQFVENGLKIRFSLFRLNPDIDAEMEVHTADMRMTDRFYFALDKVRQGVEKIAFGPKRAAERLRERGTPKEEEQFLRMSFESVVFGSDDVGLFAKITMAAGLRHYEEVGSLKLPKAYYDSPYERPNLFPMEEHEDIQTLIDEARKMIASYLYQVGTLAQRNLIEESGDALLKSFPEGTRIEACGTHG